MKTKEQTRASRECKNIFSFEKETEELKAEIERRKHNMTLLIGAVGVIADMNLSAADKKRISSMLEQFSESNK